MISSHRWPAHNHDRSLADAASHMDTPAVSMDDFSAYPHTEAGAHVALRGKERLKNAPHVLSRNAGSCVCDGHPHPRVTFPIRPGDSHVQLSLTIRVTSSLPFSRVAPTHSKILTVVRNEDGTFDILLNGDVKRGRVHEDRLERELSVGYGFCGDEYTAILHDLRLTGLWKWAL